jgi:hypothetical protein
VSQERMAPSPFQGGCLPTAPQSTANVVTGINSERLEKAPNKSAEEN